MKKLILISLICVASSYAEDVSIKITFKPKVLKQYNGEWTFDITTRDNGDNTVNYSDEIGNNVRTICIDKNTKTAWLSDIYSDQYYYHTNCGNGLNENSNNPCKPAICVALPKVYKDYHASDETHQLGDGIFTATLLTKK